MSLDVLEPRQDVRGRPPGADSPALALLRGAGANRVFRWMCGFTAFVAFATAPMLVAVSYLAYDSPSWPTVVGEVVESRVEPVSSHGHVRYRPFVRYRYQVAGEEFARRGINLSADGPTDEASAQAVVDLYPRGAKPDVHYYPRVPRISVLEPVPSWKPLYLAMASVMIGTIGAAFAWRGRPGLTHSATSP